MSYAAFDLETAKVLPEEVVDIRAHRPLGISCAALVVEGEEPYVFQNLDDVAWAPAHAQHFIERLEKLAAKGVRVASWNGLGFDLDILAEEAGGGEWFVRARDLALEHYDLMFQVMCVKGYPVSLENACKGFGLAGKLSGVGGAKAPAMWQAGERTKVLAYCAQDTRATLEVILATEAAKTFRWISKKGRPNDFACPEIWTVRQALASPVPNTSWMDTPIPREQFSAWFPGSTWTPPAPTTKTEDAAGAFDFISPKE
jgi:hypothetical protein